MEKTEGRKSCDTVPLTLILTKYGLKNPYFKKPKTSPGWLSKIYIFFKINNAAQNISANSEKLKILNLFPNTEAYKCKKKDIQLLNCMLISLVTKLKFSKLCVFLFRF
jgi:hypothetical protein